MTPEPTITAVERIYRDLKERPAQAKPDTPVPTPPATTPQLKLTRADAEDFVHDRRMPSLAEIEWLLQHQRDFKLRLTTLEVEILRNLASRLSAAARTRVSRPVDEFLTLVLGILPTDAGHLERSEVAYLRSIHLQAARAIADCKHHSPEHCPCCRDARDELFNLRSRVGEQSAMGLAALRVWDQLDELSASRSTSRSSHEAPQPQTETPFRRWDWRYFQHSYDTDPNRPRKLTELMPG